MKPNNTCGTCPTRRQKIYGIIALGGLFVCGLMVGIGINGGNSRSRDIVRDKQCYALADQILKISSYRDIGNKELDFLKDLNEAYARNCSEYEFVIEEPKVVQNAPADEVPDEKACEVIESMMIGHVYSEYTNNPDVHTHNIEIYNKLIEHGCPENAEKYRALISREQEILAALQGGAVASENVQTCAEIENLLKEQLPSYNLNDSDVRIRRAKIYANLSERGCPEHLEEYKTLAARELEIARALRDDDFSESDTVEVVETYKRLRMQQAAQDVITKVQKITNPAIDFILELEKIINEQ